MKTFVQLHSMLDLPKDQTTQIYITQITNWTCTYFLSQLVSDKSRKINAYISLSAILMPDGFTAVRLKACCACMSLTSRKHTTQATTLKERLSLIFQILIWISKST